jgi:succinate dehydrogenase / fumarate reductase cytochrome b subunit
VGRRHHEERRLVLDDSHRPGARDLRADHVWTFKYGAHYDYGNGVRDLYRLEMENFSSPLTVALYVVAMVFVGLHLWHGVGSSFQSLGLNGPRFTPAVRRTGKVFAVVIAAGFIFIAIWALLAGGRS